MGIYKRGKWYWYRFQWNGKLIRKSTRQVNYKVARSMEAAHRTSLAKGEVGIREKRMPLRSASFARIVLSRGRRRHFRPPCQRTSLGSMTTCA